MKGIRRLVILALAAAVAGVALGGYLRGRFGPRMPAGADRGASVGDLPDGLTVVADSLEIPWEVTFLPGGDLLVTQRPGSLIRMGPDGARRWVVDVPGVVHRGGGGLLGLALHPAFHETGWIYLYLTAEGENRVERYRLGDAGELLQRRVVIGGIPAAPFHNGGRLAFGPDGLLYATTGDAGDPASAQDAESLAGKILRVTGEGGIPDDNPLGSAVYSLGHRNPQGLAWDGDGILWATEHGRSGASSGYDEVNRIRAGGNYGWPDGQGDEVPAGTEGPWLHSGPRHTWAPSGGSVSGGRLYFGGLRGQALYELPLGDASASLVVHFLGELGRIRQAKVGPDGSLYLLTNNRDGRGLPGRTDDRLVRVDPAALVGGVVPPP
jgi:glucose/arabinose dehydrogenase